MTEVDYEKHFFRRTIAKERIYKLLLTSKAPFSEHLTERVLAQAIGLGRMPVREALRELARDHVVSVEPGRGTFLRRIGPAEVDELLDVRLAIEGMAAWLAATNGYVGNLPEIVAALKKLQNEPFTEAEIDKADELGDQVHMASVQGARNEILMETYLGLRMRIRISLRLVQRRDVERLRETVDEHLAIAEAILERAPHKSMEMLADHVRRGHAVTVEALERGGPLWPYDAISGPVVSAPRRRGRRPKTVNGTGLRTSSS